VLINLKPLGHRKRVVLGHPRPPFAGGQRRSGGPAVLQPVQDLTIDAFAGRRSTSSLSRARIRPPWRCGRRSWSSAWRARRSSATSLRICRTRACRRSSHRQGDGGPAGHHPATNRRHALLRVRPADHLDHLHPVEPGAGDPPGRSDDGEIAGRPQQPANSPPPAARRHRCRRSPPSRSRPRRFRSTTSASFPPPTSPSTSRPGIARAGGGGDPEGREGDRRPDHDHHGVPGRGRRLPGLPSERAVADPGGR